MKHTYRVAHIFCGMGGKGLGAQQAHAIVGDHEATFETIGGIDFDARACRDFTMLTGAPALCADVHALEPADLVKFFGSKAPDLIMMSPPCKGFSGLLSAARAAEPKYQLMNTLMERALFLIASAWPVPPPLVFVENVPRIASRGKDTLRRCIAIGTTAGYAVASGTHDCGELGNLAQHRRRWFMLWRHRAQVAAFVYEPPQHPVRACGEVLGSLPMPGDIASAGPMHSVPKLSWRNWLRLAMIPAGGDWRDLPGVLVAGQKRREKFRRDPVTPWKAAAETVTGPGGSASSNVADPRFGHVDKITEWTASMGTITRSPAPSSGAGAVADPRAKDWFHNVLRVNAWNTATGTITGAPKPSSGSIVVADPRLAEIAKLADNPTRHRNKYTVGDWNEPTPTVIGSSRPGSGAPSIADPRWGGGRLGITPWSEPSGTVAGESLPNNGKFAVADPRFDQGKKKNWQRVAGVKAWTEPAETVTSQAKIHTGAFQVADPRVAARRGYRFFTLDEAIADRDLSPDKSPPFVPVIIARDGTWHRPLTTLELAVLQSFPWRVDGHPLVLDGTSHTRWREAIGNAVPPAAARAIGNQLLRALLMSTLGVFALDSNPIWVAPHSRAMVA